MIKKVKNRTIIVASMILIIAALYFAMSFSYRLVIRRTIFLNGFPIAAFTTPIQQKPDSVDKRYGACYVIHNHHVNNGHARHNVPGVCLKKNKFGFYYVDAIGAG